MSIDELSAGLKDLGLKFTKNQVEVWCEAVDANHDGTISLDEFTQAVIFAEAKFKGGRAHEHRHTHAHTTRTHTRTHTTHTAPGDVLELPATTFVRVCTAPCPHNGKA